MLSEKQKKIFAFAESDYDAIICDGAIRSGKTSIMTVAFVDWAMANFSGQRFGICGKTADGAVKNIILPFVSMSYSKKYRIKWKPSSKVMEVSDGASRNIFEVFGGKDESSFMLIQGRTFAGAMVDEVALMPKSFVQQAIARCSVEGSKLWFSCNPAIEPGDRVLVRKPNGSEIGEFTLASQTIYFDEDGLWANLSLCSGAPGDN